MFVMLCLHIGTDLEDDIHVSSGLIDRSRLISFGRTRFLRYRFPCLAWAQPRLLGTGPTAHTYVGRHSQTYVCVWRPISSWQIIIKLNVDRLLSEETVFSGIECIMCLIINDTIWKSVPNSSSRLEFLFFVHNLHNMHNITWHRTCLLCYVCTLAQRFRG